MRRLSVLTAAVATVALSLLLTPGASAMPVGTAAGIQQGLAKTNVVEQVVRVCRHRFFTSRRYCFIDRSRPPTVCHHLTASSRRDCY
jgi:hypothetical protein